ncbi:MAG: S1 RNA-binding domain-containing protein [Armatimonadota bacterium]|nr:S1 RNA-binding domain-containing protein [Armatimonadota bacterium]MDR5696665.1 S1 RNA-binding domain-containing protein [Armatimonadota bacterium]
MRINAPPVVGGRWVGEFMFEESRDRSDEMTMESALPELEERKIVRGTVVRVDSEGVLVDVGAKSEGLIPVRELRPGEAPSDLRVGEQIDVYVMRVEQEEGNILLSKKRADVQRAWERIEAAYREGQVLHAMVVDKVKGGLVVDIGLRGFVPGSHVDLSRVKGRRFENLVGESIPLRVIEIDRDKNRVILSHKQAMEQERARLRAELFATLREGDEREGVVRRLADFGAFVDLGGVDALLPISEMSWTYIKHPSEVVRRGQTVRVRVIKVDPKAGKISLSLKQVQPDPWTDIERRHRVGEVVRGKVVRVAPSGAFVRLRDVDAWLPIGELADRRVQKVEDVVQPGASVEAVITEIRPEDRRMIVSLKRLQRDLERQQLAELQQSQREATGFTIGDVAGELLRQAIERPRPERGGESGPEPRSTGESEEAEGGSGA